MLEKMLEFGYRIGGEQFRPHDLHRLRHHRRRSAHRPAVFADPSPQREEGSELAFVCPSYPQTLVNVQLPNQPGYKEAVMASGELAEAIRREEELLGGDGRVLVRPSGTEPLIRVMVEAKTTEQAESCAARLVELVKSLKI